jgi:hypothetical protein
MLNWNNTQKDRKQHGQFYCRRENCIVGRCPLAAGPGGCPLRPECPAGDKTRANRETA